MKLQHWARRIHYAFREGPFMYFFVTWMLLFAILEAIVTHR